MFMIISPDDTQVYELNTGMLKKDVTYLHELIAFASLDMVELNEWSTNNCYLKQIDKYNEFCINCMITPGSKLFSNFRNEISIYS